MKLVHFSIFSALLFSAAASFGSPELTVSNESLLTTGLSPRIFYVNAGGGYITSGDFDGGLVAGRLGLDVFQKDIWAHSLEFEVDGIFETAKGGIFGTYQGASTLRTFKTSLDQLLLMGNYRLEIVLGDKATTPLSLYLGGGVGVDFAEYRRRNDRFFVGIFMNEITIKKNTAQFAGQLFAGLSLEPMPQWRFPVWASVGVRILMTKEIQEHYRALSVEYPTPYSFSTDFVSWIFEGAIGIGF